MTQASLFRKPRVSSTHSAMFIYNLEDLTMHLLANGTNENLDFNMEVQSLIFSYLQPVNLSSKKLELKLLYLAREGIALLRSVIQRN